MFKYFNISLFICLIALSSCDNNESQEFTPLKNNDHSREKLYAEVKKINGPCFLKFSKIIDDIISSNISDSITSIYQIKPVFVKGHYTVNDINRFVYFKSVIFDSTKNMYEIFFGIDKNHSELVYLNKLDRFRGFSVDHHVKVGQNFSFLSSQSCIREIIESDNATDSTIYYQNKTFDLNLGAVWVIDSVNRNKRARCKFRKGDSLKVFENQMFVIKNDTLRFEFKNYKLIVEESPMSIISSSFGKKIIYDSGQNYIFMSRVKK